MCMDHANEYREVVKREWHIPPHVKRDVWKLPRDALWSPKLFSCCRNVPGEQWRKSRRISQTAMRCLSGAVRNVETMFRDRRAIVYKVRVHDQSCFLRNNTPRCTFYLSSGSWVEISANRNIFQHMLSNASGGSKEVVLLFKQTIASFRWIYKRGQNKWSPIGCDIEHFRNPGIIGVVLEDNSVNQMFYNATSMVKKLYYNIP